MYSDTPRVTFECRINKIAATEDEISHLTVVWQRSDNDSNLFYYLSMDDTFNPLPGYSVLLMNITDINDLPVMVRCQAVFTSLTGAKEIFATSNTAHVNIIETSGDAIIVHNITLCHVICTL